MSTAKAMLTKAKSSHSVGTSSSSLGLFHQWSKRPQSLFNEFMLGPRSAELHRGLRENVESLLRSDVGIRGLFHDGFASRQNQTAFGTLCVAFS